MESNGMRSNKLDLCKKCGKMFLRTRDTNVCPKCAPQRYLPESTLQSTQSESPRIQLTKREESIKTIANEQKHKKWSLRHDHCVICGRNDVKHIAGGLCAHCYQKETEKRGRGKQRIAKGLASRKLDYKYLYEEYVTKKRSLSDIAKDCDCGRQYVYKRMVEFNIALRTQKEARELACDRNKIRFKRTDVDGHERLVILDKIRVNDSFFSSWSKEMSYVLGVVYTDGNLDPGSKLDPSRKTTLRIPRLSIAQKRTRDIE